jgi:hypothetical protein
MQCSVVAEHRCFEGPFCFSLQSEIFSLSLPNAIHFTRRPLLERSLPRKPQISDPFQHCGIQLEREREREDENMAHRWHFDRPGRRLDKTFFTPTQHLKLPLTFFLNLDKYNFLLTKFPLLPLCGKVLSVVLPNEGSQKRFIFR